MLFTTLLFTHTKNKLNKFKKEEKGGVLAFWAVLLPVIAILCGLIMDVTRLYVVQQELQSVVDSAALAAANEGLTINDGVNPAYAVIPYAEGKAQAERYFQENFYAMSERAELVKVEYNPEGDVNYSNGKMHVVATIKFKLMVGQLVLPDDPYFYATRHAWATVQPK